MSLESDLRAVMRAHDAEAPGSVEFVAPPDGSRRLRPALLLTASVVLVLIGATFVALAVHGRGGTRPAAVSRPGQGGPSRSGPSGAPASGSAGHLVATLPCPGRFDASSTDTPWVPAQPTVPHAGDRLAPTTTATSAVVCSYAHSPYAGSLGLRHLGGASLVGSRPIDNRRALAASLSAQPESAGGLPCASYLAVTDGDNYLIGLSYPDGLVWVSALGDHCAGSGNGAFDSRANLRSAAARAFAGGRWPTEVPIVPGGQPPRAQCDQRSQGRLGDTTRIVPGGWASIMVCRNGGRAVHTLSHSDAVALVDALNGLDSSVGDGSCQPAHGGPGTEYLVAAHYPSGPDEDVLVIAGCIPQVDNLALQATAPSRLVQHIAALAGG